MTKTTDRDKFEAGETFAVYGEQCSGLAGLRRYDSDEIFDEDGDVNMDYEIFDVSVEQAELIANNGGSFWWKVQRILNDELLSAGLVVDSADEEDVDD